MLCCDTGKQAGTNKRIGSTLLAKPEKRVAIELIGAMESANGPHLSICCFLVLWDYDEEAWISKYKQDGG